MHKDLRTGTIFLAGMLLSGCVSDVERGHRDFVQLCAGCHGAGAVGDGPAAAGLANAPADLTTVARRNGGAFPRVRVMAAIDGYRKGAHYGGSMPAFWSELEGDLVLVETAPGVMTPTPERLVALAQYIESIQR